MHLSVGEKFFIDNGDSQNPELAIALESGSEPVDALGQTSGRMNTADVGPIVQTLGDGYEEFIQNLMEELAEEIGRDILEELADKVFEHLHDGKTIEEAIAAAVNEIIAQIQLNADIVIDTAITAFRLVMGG